MAQELLTTFLDDVYGITLQPSEISGRYTIYVDNELVFEPRKREGKVQIKELKQLVRNKVNPEKFLGHSDSK